MSASMKKVGAVMDYFQDMQARFGYQETGNLLLLQWDMRVIINHIRNDKVLAMLIEFFMKVSDDRSLDHFKNNYTDYLDAMIQKRNDLAHLEYLQKQTVSKRKNNI